MIFLFNVLKMNPFSEFSPHVRISRYPNLKVQKWPFSAISVAIYHKQRSFFLKSTFAIVYYFFLPFISILYHSEPIFILLDMAHYPFTVLRNTWFCARLIES